jgi:predicted nuclease with TOPRIM domain
MSDEIPSLTLKVLERIQTELVGLRGDVQDVRGGLQELRGDVQDVRGGLQELRGDVQDLRGEVKLLGARFDHFLEFVGRDVQDLKHRVTAVELHLGLGKPTGA